jgi:PAS domain S-box-containing protein
MNRLRERYCFHQYRNVLKYRIQELLLYPNGRYGSTTDVLLNLPLREKLPVVDMYRRRFIPLVTLIILITAGVWWYVNHWYYSEVKEETRLQVSTEALPYRESFCAALQERFALLEGLYGFAGTLSEEELGEHFTSFARDLHDLKRGIRNMSIAPGGVQKYVYPLESNRKVEGHDLLEDPREEVQEDVRAARERREIVISGPYELRQGGQGIVARKAVFKEGHFWGLVAMVLDMPPIYEQSRLDEAESLVLALHDSEDSRVWGKQSVLEHNPVSIEFEVAGEGWTMFAVPEEGWNAAYNAKYTTFFITTLLVAILSSLGMILLVSRFTAISESVKLERARYRDLFNSIRDTIVVTDNARTILEMNQPALRKMFGYELKELQGRKTDILYARTSDYLQTGHEIYDRKKSSGGRIMEIPFKQKDGRVFPAELTAFKLYNRNRRIIGNIGIIRDISERKKYERTLEDNIQRKQWLNELAAMYLSGEKVERVIGKTVNELSRRFPEVRAAYSTIDEAGTLKVVYARQPEGMPDITSLEADLTPAGEYLSSLRNQKKTIITDTASDPRIAPLQEAMRSGATSALIDIAVPVEGKLRGLLCLDSPAPREWSEHEIATLEEHANLLMLILNNAAYHERIENTNRALRESVEEKEILLKEIHHRVKNNLNVIVSLLKLQEREIDSVEKAYQAFQESRRRIYSMALVHESLYRSDNLSEIELGGYLQSLVGELRGSLTEGGKVEHDFKVEPVYVDVTKAVPCGIIVNELVSNAVKHAFPEGSHGEITVSLRKTTDSYVELLVADNGAGLPEEFSIEKHTSLGLNLVSILAKQIDANLSIDTSEGTIFTLTFEVEEDRLSEKRGRE